MSEEAQYLGATIEDAREKKNMRRELFDQGGHAECGGRMWAGWLLFVEHDDFARLGTVATVGPLCAQVGVG